jgi:hypothetical protein
MLKLIKSRWIWILWLALLPFQQCGVKYSFQGGSIPEGMKSFTVHFFENNAIIVNPTLSNVFTEDLKSYLRSTTGLRQVENDADGVFEGNITNYSISSEAVQATTDRAALNRLTITVQVKYTNRLRPADNFEQSFTQSKQMDASAASIQAQENRIAKDIYDQIIIEIYKRAFANW